MVQSLIVLQPLDFKTQLFCPVFYNFRVIEITETQFSKKIKSAKVTLLESKHGSLLMLNSVKAFFRHFTVNYIFPIKDQKWHHFKKKVQMNYSCKEKNSGKTNKKTEKKNEFELMDRKCWPSADTTTLCPFPVFSVAWTWLTVSNKPF